MCRWSCALKAHKQSRLGNGAVLFCVCECVGSDVEAPLQAELEGARSEILDLKCEIESRDWEISDLNEKITTHDLTVDELALRQVDIELALSEAKEQNERSAEQLIDQKRQMNLEVARAQVNGR